MKLQRVEDYAPFEVKTSFLEEVGMTSYITRRNDNEILISSNSFLTVYSEGIRLLYSARIMPKFTANTSMLPFGGARYSPGRNPAFTQ